MFARYISILIVMTVATTGPAAAVTGPGPYSAIRSGTITQDQSSKMAASLVGLMNDQPAPYRVWVFFQDKGIATADEYGRAIARVQAGYNQRAIDRRRMRGDNAARGGALFDHHDLPLVEEYVQAVIGYGADLRVESTWLNAVSVEATADQIDQIASLPFVTRMQPVARRLPIEPMVGEKADGPTFGGFGPATSVDYGLSLEQLTQINLVALHDEGFTGQGVIVGILDTGFVRTHDAFNHSGHEVNIVAEWDFINDDPNTGIESGDPPSQHNHGTYILGTLGAYLPGELVGGAYDASFILCKTEDVSDEYQGEEDFYVAGLQFIEANGGDMFTSSLSYLDWYTQDDMDGQTAVTTIGVNIATANGMYGCTAASNNGHDDDPNTSHLGAPADALQVLSCGAVDSGGSIASFSSDGPTADDRVKPEVLARGVDTQTVDPNDDDAYRGVGGTSLSTPLVADAVACLVQAHPDWTVDELRNALMNTADYYLEYGTFDPLYVRGYGIMNAHAASQGISFAFPNGLPTSFEAGVETTVAVQVRENYDGPIEPGSEKMFYRTGDAFIETSLTHLGGEDYEATFPAFSAGTLVQFYFQVQTESETFYHSPMNAPDDLYEAGVLKTYHSFMMDSDPGWSTEGQWAYGQPTGNGGDHGGPDPDSGYTGDNVFGYNLNGDYTNDIPEYDLTSDALDCSELTNTSLRFYRWLGVEQPAYDHAYVRVSNDGVNWTTVWQNDAEIADTAWTLVEYDISAVADGQETVYLRWTMGETDGGWVYCGWNIDDVEIRGINPNECPEDVTNDSVVDIDDLFAVLGHWGETGGDYDVNSDGVVDIDDVFAVLAAWGPCA